MPRTPALFLSFTACWAPPGGTGRRGWANALSERLVKSRRIIIPDLRNHGESPHTRSALQAVHSPLA
eukprot:763522-Hanusia_phi.AAC.5